MQNHNRVEGQSVLMNPFEQEGQWFKANLHTHSTESDGDTSIGDRIREYREKGYDILAITDHEKTCNPADWSSEDFLIIGGMETHPLSPIPDNKYHLVCLNVPFEFTLPKDADASTRVRMVKEVGGEVIYAHPYWCGHNINTLLNVNGFTAMEVFNATCSKYGKGYSSVHWDDLLTHGLTVPAVAVDDVHGGRDKFMGWTMFKLQNLSVDAVMEALRRGCFYSSCGPEIFNFGINDGKAFVESSAVAEIHLMGQRDYGNSIYADDGPDLTRAELTLPEGMRYVRAEVVDRQGRRAWTNPIRLKF